ncbi:MAG: hypothetical protein J6V53_04575 [Alphaproteobacteria bacterium]|nr:hypothetical protein [Alphaproteobacteria bacterium]
MQQSFLQKQIQKNIFKQKLISNICLSICSLFTLNIANNVYCNFISPSPTSKQKNSFFKYADLVQLPAFLFLFYQSLKIRREDVDNTLTKSSLTKEVLNELRYFYDEDEKENDIYSSLTPKDIENLTKVIDFSGLPYLQQYEIIQSLILVAHLNPVVAKNLKSPLLPCQFKINQDMLMGGNISHGKKSIKKGLISIQNYLDITAITHELLHAKQIMDGAFLPQELDIYSHLMAEAHGRSLNLILSATDNTTGYFVKMRNPMGNWIKKILKIQKHYISQNNKCISEREKLGKAQERTMGILMKCLIEGNDDLREKIIQRYCYDQLNYIELEEMHLEVNCWRITYIKEDHEIKEEKLKNILPNLTYDLKLVPHLNDYYSNETGIPQQIESIKISSSQNSVLYDYLKAQKQKTK